MTAHLTAVTSNGTVCARASVVLNGAAGAPMLLYDLDNGTLTNVQAVNALTQQPLPNCQIFYQGMGRAVSWRTLVLRSLFPLETTS